jgi:diphthamide biosynthesis protein 2
MEAAGAPNGSAAAGPQQSPQAAPSPLPSISADDATWETPRVVQYVLAHGFSRVTLQFPDELLGCAAGVAAAVQHALQQQGSSAKVYVLADTSYNPLSVDEVAAAHVAADCIVS